ncbi:MAG: hypothetical protein IPP32_11520 [Bacteroidetes bacterium]|nr:hypothetical protein [Bacteroidota bacterium]
MDSENYFNRITVHTNSHFAFDALTKNLSSWWTKVVEGDASNKGDTFTVRFGTSYLTLNVVESIPEKKILWKCTDAFFDIPSIRDKKELVGSLISLEILVEKDKSQIHLTHFGLDPFLECYDEQVKNWRLYFEKSLQSYLNTKQGTPFA